MCGRYPSPCIGFDLIAICVSPALYQDKAEWSFFFGSSGGMSSSWREQGARGSAAHERESAFVPGSEQGTWSWRLTIPSGRGLRVREKDVIKLLIKMWSFLMRLTSCFAWCCCYALVSRTARGIWAMSFATSQPRAVTTFRLNKRRLLFQPHPPLGTHSLVIRT